MSGIQRDSWAQRLENPAARDAWEYSFQSVVPGRMDLWLARIQAMGAEGWEVCASTGSTLWLKRRLRSESTT